MQAKTILAVAAVIFLVLAAARIAKDGRIQPASKTWLMIGAIFALVSAWLFYAL